MPKQPVSGQGTTEVKSPGGKKNLDFNFEDAWKAESKPQQSNNNQANKNPMNNPPPVNKPADRPKFEEAPKPEDNKKRATFNNLFGFK